MDSTTTVTERFYSKTRCDRTEAEQGVRITSVVFEERVGAVPRVICVKVAKKNR